MANINLSILKYALNIISNKIFNTTTPGKHLIEPFSTILNLAIISYRSEGTKLAIYNNKLFIQSPNLLQAPIRYVYGNNREELHYLLIPLMIATELYPPEKNEDIKNIYNLAINGLRKLKSSYNNGSSTVCHTIDLYISILNRKVLEKSIHVDSYDLYKNDECY